MTMSDFILRAMSVPFADKGRSYESWDCFGLVFCAYRDVFGVQLPAYTDDYDDAGESSATRAQIKDAVLEHKRKWEQVDNPQAMDVVLFCLGGQPLHVGLMIDKKNFIHCEKKIGVVIENIHDTRWKLRKEGVYRLCRA
jgi:cell wall-associated NlpC family hydrolase